MYIFMYVYFHLKCLLFLADFSENLSWLTRCIEPLQYENYMKIHSVGSEMFRAYGRTERWTGTDSRMV